MLSCRFYAEKCPKVGDIVVGKPIRVTDLCAYVHLLEYDNLEAMLTIGELSRRRIRSVNKLLKIGRTEYLQVIRVNEKTRCIDLSKSSVSEQDAAKCRGLYSRAKTVNSILYRVADFLNFDKPAFEELYRKTAWHVDSKQGGRKTASVDFFSAAVGDRSMLDELDIDDETKAVLFESIHLKLAKKNVKIGAVIEVTCFEKAGIDAIKDALMAGKELSGGGVGGGGDVAISINLIAPPAFNIVVQTPDPDEGIVLLGKALGVIQDRIQEHKGELKVVTDPRRITEEDEKDLVAQLEELELQNAETPADDQSDSAISDSD